MHDSQMKQALGMWKIETSVDVELNKWDIFHIVMAKVDQTKLYRNNTPLFSLISPKEVGTTPFLPRMESFLLMIWYFFGKNEKMELIQLKETYDGRTGLNEIA